MCVSSIVAFLSTVSATSAQTARFVADLNPGSAGSFVANAVDLDGVAYFFTRLPEYGLWRSDGTAAGTSQVMPFPSPTQSLAELTALRDRVVFIRRTSTGSELWSSDGTAAGTMQLSSTSAFGISAAGDIAYVTISSVLYRTDGTVAGTYQLAPFRGSWPTSFDGVTWFANSTEIWTSDGTVAGTTLWEQGVAVAALSIRLANSELWFVESPATEHVFSSVDSRAGTRTQRFTLPRPYWGQIDAVVGFADAIWFTVRSGGSGGAPFDLYRWTSANGVETFSPGVSPSFTPRGFTVHGDKMYFSGVTAQNREPWVCDGTLTGILQLADIHPTGASEPYFLPVPSSRRQYFLARPSGSVQNYRIWETDGTPAGTRETSPVQVEVNDSYTPFVAVNGKSFFNGVDVARGAELWQFDPGAVQQPLGAGCGTGAIPPSLSGTDPVIGGTTTFDGTASLSGITAAILLGIPSPSPVELMANTRCFGFVDMGMPTIDLFAPVTAGRFALTVGVPNNLELIGMPLMAQAVAFPSAYVLGFDVTNGSLVVFGQ